MERGDEELLLWVMTYGKDNDVVMDRYADNAEYWYGITSLLMHKGYVERYAQYSNGHTVYYITSTGLYRLNQMQAEEERRLKLNLKEKQNE